MALSGAERLNSVLVVSPIPAQQRVSTALSGAHAYTVRAFAEMLDEASPALEAEPTSKDDMAFFLYTSGSTGKPKGAVHLQHDMLISTQLFARGVLGVSERDVCFSASKLFFAYGLGNGSYFPFSVGAAAVYSPHRPKPETILAKAGALLDLDQPVAVVLNAVLHHIPERDDPYAVVARLMDGVASGSYLAMSHLTDDLQSEAMRALSQSVPRDARYTFAVRSRADFARFFEGLELVEPGIVPIDQWRPDDWEITPEGRYHFGAVGRKP